MAVNGLGSSAAFSSVQVIQSAQNKERLQRQAEVNFDDQALAQRERERQAQNSTPQRSEGLSASESMPSADKLETIYQQLQEQNSRMQQRSPQSRAAAAYGQVAAQSAREQLNGMMSISIYA